MARTIVFLDANILFSAAWREGSGLLRLWRDHSLSLVTSAFAVQEAERNLETPEQAARLARLLADVGVVQAGTANVVLDVPLPEKDVPIMQAAIATRAEVLLTGDVRHFGPFFGRAANGVRVLRPADLLRERATR